MCVGEVWPASSVQTGSFQSLSWGESCSTNCFCCQDGLTTKCFHLETSSALEVTAAHHCGFMQGFVLDFFFLNLYGARINYLELCSSKNITTVRPFRKKTFMNERQLPVKTYSFQPVAPVLIEALEISRHLSKSLPSLSFCLCMD